MKLSLTTIIFITIASIGLIALFIFLFTHALFLLIPIITGFLVAYAKALRHWLDELTTSLGK